MTSRREEGPLISSRSKVSLAAELHFCKLRPVLRRLQRTTRCASDHHTEQCSFCKCIGTLEPSFHIAALGTTVFSVFPCFLPFLYFYGSVVGSGTILQAARSRVLFLMRSLDFSVDVILPVALWPLGSTQPLREMSTKNLPRGK
jgi:hypothetical protein